MSLTGLSFKFLRSLQTNMAATYKVLHKQGLFYIELEKGNAKLEYDLKDDVMDMYHTGVPTAYRGHGIAKVLVEEALKYAEVNQMSIKPTCSYVLKYITDNPNPLIKVI